MNRCISFFSGFNILLLLLLILSSDLYGSDVILPEKGLCAHRGAMATHPENTLPAFQEAVNAGAHMIEFDVFLTKDNHMVVIHDETVDRTTNGTGKVADLTLAQIKDLDAGSWKSPEFAGLKIPTIDEVLNLMPVNVWLNIHLKGEGRLSVMVSEKIASEKRLHQAFLACSRNAALAARKAVPGIMICNMDRQNNSSDYVNGTIDMKADFIQLTGSISPEFADYAKLLKNNHIRVNYYGTDSPEQLRILFDYGIDFPLVNDITNSIRVAAEMGIQPVKPEFFNKYPAEDQISDEWPENCRKVEIVSSIDGNMQPAMFLRSGGNMPRPLVVSLHTWSGGYDQKDTLAWQCLEKNYNYIHPHFRGRNNNPDACGSHLAIRDIDDAISYALNNACVDRSSIHVVGSSGGGYATLLTYMNSSHNIKSYSAWVAISDLVKWFYESEGRKSNYARDIARATGGWTNENNYTLGLDEAIKRSPYFMKTPVKKRKYSKLMICAGIHDGYTGSVPITHSLLFYNKLMKDFDGHDAKNLIPDQHIIELVASRNFINKPQKMIGARQILYEKNYKDLITLIIFDGGHEMLSDVALDQISDD